MTVYPAQIDSSISLPTISDNRTPVQASNVNILRDTLIQIESELGIKPSGIYSTVKSRLDTLEGIIGNLTVISLSGDLGGTISHPVVIGIQGRPVSSQAPPDGYSLIWNGIAWAPGQIKANSGDIANNIVTGIQGRPVSNNVPQTNDVLTWNGTSYTPEPVLRVSGDIGGTIQNPEVIGLRSFPIANVTPLANQALVYDGSQWTAESLSLSIYSTLYKDVTASPYTPTLSTNVTLMLDVDSTSGAFILNLPVSPTNGQSIIVKDYAGTSERNNITINGNGNLIDNSSSFVLALNYGSVTMIYNSAWRVV